MAYSFFFIVIGFKEPSSQILLITRRCHREHPQLNITLKKSTDSSILLFFFSQKLWITHKSNPTKYRSLKIYGYLSQGAYRRVKKQHGSPRMTKNLRQPYEGLPPVQTEALRKERFRALSAAVVRLRNRPSSI